MASQSRRRALLLLSSRTTNGCAAVRRQQTSPNRSAVAGACSWTIPTTNPWNPLEPHRQHQHQLWLRHRRMIGTLSIESNSSTRPRWTSTMGMAHCRKGRPRRASSFLHRLFFFPSNVEKGNPFLKVLQQQQQERITGSEPTISTIPTEDATTLKTITQSSNSSPDDTYNNKSLLFQFGHAQPHHVPAAMEFLQSQKDNITLLLQAIQSLSNLLLEETEPAIGRHSSEKATIVPTERFQRQLNQVLVRLDAVEQPWFALRQLTSLMWLLTSFNTETMEDENSDWQRMAAIVSSAKTFALEPTTERQEQQRAVYHVILDLTRKLKPFLSLPYPLGSESTVHSARLGLWTLQQWLRQSDHANSRVGASTMIVAESVEREDRGSGETDQSSSLVKTTPNELIDALRKVEQEVNQISSRRQAATNASPQSLAAIYNYIGLSHEIALRSGHDSVAHQVLAESMPSLSSMALSPSTASTFLEEIKLLHSQVTEHLVPYISKTVGVSPSPDDAMLHANYLSATGGPSTAMPRKSEAEQQRRDDYLSMLKLERHVTLDGALLCIFRLLQDILGVTIEPAHVEESAIWNKDVRLYHAFDDLNAQSFLGSFYLDPFHRNGKFARSATLPIFPKGYHELAQAVCVSLELPVPAWDSDPVMVSWNDCEALFHELGHVAQFLLVKPSGCLFGPQNMPLAFSEFLPKFMELWLTEKSTLYALIAMSNTDTPLSDDSIDAAYRIRSHEKALQLVHHTFYGSLELELFSGFDLRGSESVVALQNRLAREIIPHDIPSPKDLTPLMDIMKENVQGRRVAWHRYVWCEAMSASFLERCHEQSSKNENTSEQFKHQLRLDVRRFLLEPGAAVDFAAFRSHFNVNPCQPTALMQRYDL